MSGIRSVKINSIQINNFGPYRDQSIEFSPLPKKNLTLIVGDQGTGKTMMLSFIWWILFSQIKEPTYIKFLEGGNRDLAEIVNSITKESSSEGDIIEVGGILNLSERDFSGNETEYEIRRYVNYLKKDGKLSFIKNSEKIEFKKDGISATDPEKKFEEKIPSLFQQETRKFVIIHGEEMEKRLSPRNVEQLKEFAISMSDSPRICALDKLLALYGEYVANKRKEASKNNKKANQISNERDNLVWTKETKIKKKNDLSKEVLEAEKHIADIKKDLDDMAENQVTVERLNQLKEECKNYRKEIDSLAGEREILLKEAGPIIFLEKAMKRCRDDLKDKEDNLFRLIPKESLEMIKESDSACICGREWTEESKETLEIAIENSPEGELGRIAYSFKKRIDSELNELESKKIAIISIETSIREKNDNIQSRTNKMETLKQQLTPEQREETWYTRMKDLFDESNQFSISIGALEQEIRELEKEIAEKDAEIQTKNNQYSQAENDAGINPNLKIKASKVANLMVILDKAETKIEESIRLETEKQTLKAFRQLTTDPENWKKVDIVPHQKGWQIQAINMKTNEKVIASTGYANLLGYSFFFALSSALGVQLPLIFDSPFGSLGGQSRVNVAEKLPKMYEGRQLIFFEKDVNLLGPKNVQGLGMDLIPKLKGFIGRQYILKNEDKVNTIIKEV